MGRLFLRGLLSTTFIKREGFVHTLSRNLFLSVYVRADRQNYVR